MDEINGDDLRLTFTPNTIEHLGVRMYSTIPPVVAELVANSHDADSGRVNIRLYDESEKRIIVEDFGSGMSYQEVNKKFLRIGRNRRDEEGETTDEGRYVIGKKGLGKLSFFGISKKITVETVKDGVMQRFTLVWDDILGTSSDDPTREAVYEPTVELKDEPTDKADGTKIILDEIDRSTDFDAPALALSLSKIFIVDSNFSIFVYHNDQEEVKVTNSLRFNDLDKEFTWKIPDDLDVDGYFRDKGVSGEIITARKPISPKHNLRGVTLFSRKKLVNAPDYFSDSTSSHFYSYVTGWLTVDFIDEIKPDVIGTNRQSLDWKREETSELREKLRALLRVAEIKWREERARIQDEQIAEATGIDLNEWQSEVPADVQKSLNPVINALKKESTEHPEKQATMTSSIKSLRNLIPPYTYFHYRKLHPELQNVVFDAYRNENYYTAVFEGVKRYKNAVKTKSGSSLTDRNLLENVFQNTNPVLSVTKGFTKRDGTDFENDTITNISEGHRQLVIATWQAFRSPIAHEEVEDLRDSGLYTEQDCLDALSLISHLFYRLDRSSSP